MIHPRQEVEVVRSEHVPHDLDRVEALSASEDAENDVVEWTGRQVTSTRAPPSGMKRKWRLMPIRSRKTEGESFTRLQTFSEPLPGEGGQEARERGGATPLANPVLSLILLEALAVLMLSRRHFRKY
jgi:hypothetical protein